MLRPVLNLGCLAVPSNAPGPGTPYRPYVAPHEKQVRHVREWRLDSDGHRSRAVVGERVQAQVYMSSRATDGGIRYHGKKWRRRQYILGKQRDSSDGRDGAHLGWRQPQRGEQHAPRKHLLVLQIYVHVHFEQQPQIASWTLQRWFMSSSVQRR